MNQEAEGRCFSQGLDLETVLEGITTPINRTFRRPYIIQRECLRIDLCGVHLLRLHAYEI